MPVVYDDYVRRELGEVHCAQCGTPTDIPFDCRGPCECGSNAWTAGCPMTWPPPRHSGMYTPAFLYGLFIPALARIERHPEPQREIRATSRPARKLTQDDADEIRRLAGEGTARNFIAEQFGVTEKSVARILSGKYWAQEA